MVPKNITLKIILLNIFIFFISRTCELQLQYHRENPAFFLYYCKIQQHTIQKLLLVVFCNVKFLCQCVIFFLNLKFSDHLKHIWSTLKILIYFDVKKDRCKLQAFIFNSL